MNNRKIEELKNIVLNRMELMRYHYDGEAIKKYHPKARYLIEEIIDFESFIKVSYEIYNQISENDFKKLTEWCNKIRQEIFTEFHWTAHHEPYKEYTLENGRILAIGTLVSCYNEETGKWFQGYISTTSGKYSVYNNETEIDFLMYYGIKIVPESPFAIYRD